MKPSLRYVVEGFCLRHLDQFRALQDRFETILQKKHNFCYAMKPVATLPTFAGHKSSSYRSYEDNIDTNRILLQNSNIIKRPIIKISCLR